MKIFARTCLIMGIAAVATIGWSQSRGIRELGGQTIGIGSKGQLGGGKIGDIQLSSVLDSGVELKAQINLSTFGASAGNDCWGYTSPSGREYALMGLNNQVAFVEITNPSNPVIIAQIPHSSSSWGDIKVYGHFAYAVTETAGTGVQVIDMSQIDNGVVTLVKTISNPGRSHNVVMDEQNGFLYTVGSNQSGSRTTICFDLTDPANPVDVNPGASITLNYHHDAVIYNYTSGPWAGKQIWFGFSEGRGVDIYDVTNKQSPVFLSRATYPNIGYCHQGWLSADGRYLYVDDEFDESNLLQNTRSIIFDVQDLANPVFVSFFSSGLPAIDHNQYVVDGFTFQANYRSGLQIFDIKNPTSPIRTGFYDTYPANDNRGFNGAWSTYPFFASGNIIVSDINSGLFVLDPRQATTRTVLPANFQMLTGFIESGSLGNINDQDGVVLTMSNDGAGEAVDQIAFELTFQTFDTKPMQVDFQSIAKTNLEGLQQEIDVYNWTTGQWDLATKKIIKSHFISHNNFLVSNFQDYVNQSNRAMKFRVRYVDRFNFGGHIVVNLDQFQVRVER